MATKSSSHSILRTTTPSTPNVSTTAPTATPGATPTPPDGGGGGGGGAEVIPPLPPVEQRLADLRPSRELLEFYRQKVAEYDDEYSQLLKRLVND